MARSASLIAKRNEHVKARFRYHRKKNPKWTVVAVIAEVADEIFLSDVTVAKILKAANEKNVPDPSTISRNKPLATA